MTIKKCVYNIIYMDGREHNIFLVERPYTDPADHILLVESSHMGHRIWTGVTQSQPISGKKGLICRPSVSNIKGISSNPPYQGSVCCARASL